MTGAVTATTSPVTHPALSAELAGGILTVTLANPDRRNPQSPSLWRALAEIGAHLPAGTRAVVLRAQGASFSAGLDRRMLAPEGIPGEGSLIGFAALPDTELADLIEAFQAAFAWWRRADVVTVAAVQGHAVGAGFQLALACDVMVVADDVALSMKEPSLGLVPDLGGTLPLVRAVGYGRALELVVSGRFVGAEEAVRIGLAHSSAPRESLDEAALAIARSCATAPPGAISATKALLRDATAGPDWAVAHDAAMHAERTAQVGRIQELARMLGLPVG